MASQTGSIDLTASNGVKLMAEAGFENIEGNYATKAELDVQADRIGMVVANNDASSSLQLTADAMTYIGNNVTIKGTDGTTTAISGGRIQANSLSIGALDQAAQSVTLNSNISVGGRNLLTGTGDYSTKSTVNQTGITVSSDTFGGTKVLVGTWSSGNMDMGRFANAFSISLQPDSDYTLSFWAKATAAINVVSYLFTPSTVASGENSSGNTTTASDGAITTTLSTEWERYWVTWHTSTAASQATQVIAVRVGSGASEKTVYVAGVKFEQGNKATDWSPAPEDVDSAISDAAKTATSYVTDITGGGVMVHPSDDATTGVRITSDVDIMRDGTSVINIGTNDAVRIGVDDNAHVKMLLESDAMSIENESGDEIFSIDSGSTGTSTVALTASLVTWDTTASVDTSAHPVSDTGTASGTTTVTATINGTGYTLGSTYATATVTAGTGVSVALTSAGVTYVQGLMVETVEGEDGPVTTTYPCELSVEYQHTVTDKATMSLTGSQTIGGEGDIIYMVNDKWSSTRNTSTLIRARNAATGREVKFGVATDGRGRGIWDSYKRSWLIYRDANDKTVIGGPNFSVDASGNVKSGGTAYPTNLLITGWVKKLTSNWSSSNQNNAFFWTENSVTGQRVAFGIGDSGYNRGIWDSAKNRWIVVKNQSDQVTYYGLRSNFEIDAAAILSGSTSISGGGITTGTTSVSRSGWYPVAVAGWNANTRYALPARLYLSARGNGTGTISWGIYNPGSSAQTPTVTAYVLWAMGD